MLACAHVCACLHVCLGGQLSRASLPARRARVGKPRCRWSVAGRVAVGPGDRASATVALGSSRPGHLLLEAAAPGSLGLPAPVPRCSIHLSLPVPDGCPWDRGQCEGSRVFILMSPDLTGSWQTNSLKGAEQARETRQPVETARMWGQDAGPLEPLGLPHGPGPRCCRPGPAQARRCCRVRGPPQRRCHHRTPGSLGDVATPPTAPPLRSRRPAALPSTACTRPPTPGHPGFSPVSAGP